MEAEALSKVALYGDYEFFTRHQKAGFTHYAFGTRPWVDNWRLVGVFILYHPDGKVATFETWKTNDGICTRHGKGEHNFNKEEFDAFAKEWQITLSSQDLLAPLLRMWNGKVRSFQI